MRYRFIGAAAFLLTTFAGPGYSFATDLIDPIRITTVAFSFPRPAQSVSTFNQRWIDVSLPFNDERLPFVGETWLPNSLVVGITADASPIASSYSYCGSSCDNYALTRSIAGKAGLSFDRSLLYMAGGIGTVESASFTQAKETLAWHVNLGIHHAISEGVTLFAEYELRSAITSCSPYCGAPVSSRFESHGVWLGLSVQEVSWWWPFGKPEKPAQPKEAPIPIWSGPR